MEILVNWEKMRFKMIFITFLSPPPPPCFFSFLVYAYVLRGTYSFFFFFFKIFTAVWWFGRSEPKLHRRQR